MVSAKDLSSVAGRRSSSEMKGQDTVKSAGQKLVLLTGDASSQVGRSPAITQDDPLENLLNEFSSYDDSDFESAEAILVRGPKVALDQSDEEMIHTLDGQLGALRDGISRLRFYLSDVDTTLPR